MPRVSAESLSLDMIGVFPPHWKEMTLSDVCTQVTDGTHDSPKEVVDGFPLVTGKAIKNRRIDFSIPYNISAEDHLKVVARSKAERDDILFANIGNSIGDLVRVQSDKDFSIKNVALFKPNKEIINPRFLEYYLFSNKVQSFIKNSTKGSAQPFIGLASLRGFPVAVPPKDEQDYIAKILGDMDDKIELNRQTNHTLEHIAQAIFKSWFVDFEPTRAKIAAKQAGQDPERAAMAAISGKPVEELESLQQTTPAQYEQLKTTAALFPDALVDSELGEIPEGWEVACIDDVCDFQNGYAFKSKEMSKSPADTYKVFKMGHIKKGGGLNQAGTKDYYDKDKCEKLGRYLIKKGDLLMCMTDMKNNVALLGHTALMDVDDEYILNQRVGLLRSKNVRKANYPYLYILTNSEVFLDDLRSRANSGVQVNLSTKEIKDTKFILPSEKVHVAFDEVVERAQETIFSLEAEQEYFAELRDALLPKLLSGDLDSTAA